MHAFRTVVFAAALSGLLVGLLVSAIQQFGTVPLIARGEVFEKAGAAPHDHGAAGHAHDAAAAGHAHAAASADEGWEPADGLERNAYTVLFNVVEQVGFGLVIAGALLVAGRRPGWREGLLWGFAGFLVFVLAPGLGLPPELPGVPAAPLGPRQLWWIATAAATAAALGLLVFTRSPLAAAAAVVLLVLPHVVGAPVLPEVKTAVPDDLSRRFVAVVLVTTFLSWTGLGALTGLLSRRFAGAGA